MSPEALLLALTTVIRPTTVAALFAILGHSRPLRLLVAYIVGGLAFSLAIGVVVVTLLRGIGLALSSSASRPVLDIVLGGAALGYASAVWAGWQPRRGTSGPAEAPGWLHRHLRKLSIRSAAAAGVLTHLPGVIYLAALNAITGSALGVVDGLFQVAVYNAIWFSLPFFALAMVQRRPNVTRKLLKRLRSWILLYRRRIVVLFLALLGGYLVSTGIVHLVQAAT
ncbi:MAG TPA: GAP family protein [Pseudonocardia sp.]